MPDRCLMWLSYIYLTEFCRLPPSLYDPATSSPSRMVCTDAFLIPWRTATRTPADTIISLFTGEPRYMTFYSERSRLSIFTVHNTLCFL